MQTKTNLALLREVQAEAGVEIQWPIKTPEAFSVLRAMQYRPSRPRLDYAVKKGNLRPPRKQGVDFAWVAADIVAFADALEVARAWAWMSPLHSHKLTARERERHTREAHKIKMLVKYLKDSSIDELIDIISGSTDPEILRAAATILRQKVGQPVEVPAEVAELV